MGTDDQRDADRTAQNMMGQLEQPIGITGKIIVQNDPRQQRLTGKSSGGMGQPGQTGDGRSDKQSAVQRHVHDALSLYDPLERLVQDLADQVK
jgi:hypothetical protein